MAQLHRNPVWSGYLADPYVLCWNGTYYAYGTGSPENRGRQADGRLFPVLRSCDFLVWEWIGGALDPLPDAGELHYWAPAVAAHNGRFYLYYSAGGDQGQQHALRVAVADSPEGPFVDTDTLLFPDEPFSIDADPFQDPVSGAWYLFFARDYLDEPAGTALAAAPLGGDMTSIAGPSVTILRAAADWEIYARNRFWYGRVWPAWYTLEGPHVVYHNGLYYCLYSGGRWETPDYGVSFCVAEKPLGPYRRRQGSASPAVLSALPGSVSGPGHAMIATAPDGAPYLIYHAWNLRHTMRQMHRDPLLWREDGPVCAGPTARQ